MKTNLTVMQVSIWVCLVTLGVLPAFAQGLRSATPHKLLGMPVLGGVPQAIREANPTVERHASERYELLFRLTAHPEVLDQYAKAFHEYGVKNAQEKLGRPNSDLAKRLLGAFVPRDRRGEYGEGAASEFERIRKLNDFLAEHRGLFSKMHLETPLRIVFARQAKLGDYDRTRGGFPLQGGAPRPNVPGVEFAYETPPRDFNFLEMAPDRAERLLLALRRREVIVVVSYVVSDIAPLTSAEAEVKLRNETHAVFHPARLQKPLLVKRSPKQSSDAIARAEGQPASGDQPTDSVAERMAKISREFNLLNLDGIPVLNPKGYAGGSKLATVRMAKGFAPPLVHFLDRLVLYADPDVLSVEREKADFNPLPLLLRQLPTSTLAKYAVLDRMNVKYHGNAYGKKQLWKGANQFEQERTRKRFYETHRNRILSRAMAPPFRFAFIGELELKYSADLAGFEIRFRDFYYRNAGEITGAKTTRSGKELFRPMPFKISNVWRMSPADAEGLINTLQPVRGSQDSYRAFVALMADVPAEPLAIPKRDPKTNHPGSWTPAKMVLLPRTLTVYRDENLRDTITQLPIETPTAAVLLASEPQPASSGERRFIDDPVSCVGLLHDADQSLVSPFDWWSAAADQHARDKKYYRTGRVTPAGIGRSLKRGLNSLRPPGDTSLDFLRQTPSLPESSVRNGPFYDLQHRPFFPDQFDLPHGVNECLTEPQLVAFKSWARQRARNASGRYSVPCIIKSVEDNDETLLIEPLLTTIRPGDRSIAGQVIREGAKRGGMWRLPVDHSYRDPVRTEIVVELPCLPERLQLSDISVCKKIREHQEFQRSGSRLLAELEVRVTGIDALPARDEDGRPTRVALIEAQPAGLRVYGAAPDSLNILPWEVEQRLFVETPISAQRYTYADLAEELRLAARAQAKRVALERRAAEQAKRQRVEEKRLAEERQRAQREQERRERELAEAERRLEHDRLAGQRTRLAEQTRRERLARFNQPTAITPVEADERPDSGLFAYVGSAAGSLVVLGAVVLAYRRLRSGRLGSDGAALVSRFGDQARVIADLSKIKLLEAADLPNAYFAVGLEAYKNRFKSSLLSERYEQVEKLEGKIVAKQEVQHLDQHATLFDKGRELARRTRGQVEIETLKQKRRMLLVRIGEYIFDEPLLKSSEELASQIERTKGVLNRIKALRSRCSQASKADVRVAAC